jgi:hypothetical protein
MVDLQQFHFGVLLRMQEMGLRVLIGGLVWQKELVASGLGSGQSSFQVDIGQAWSDASVQLRLSESVHCGHSALDQRHRLLQAVQVGSLLCSRWHPMHGISEK